MLRVVVLQVVAFAAVTFGMRIQVRSGNNLQLTDSMRSYADQKLSKPLARHAELLQGDNVEVHLKVQARSRHDNEHLGKEAHTAEITAHCVDKVVIHCASTSDDMYTSLDELSDTLTRKLRKYKERRSDLKENRRREDKLDLEENWSLADDQDDEM